MRPTSAASIRKRALMTYWALGSREMVGVEFLHNVGDVSARQTRTSCSPRVQDPRLPRRPRPGDRVCTEDPMRLSRLGDHRMSS